MNAPRFNNTILFLVPFLVCSIFSHAEVKKPLVYGVFHSTIKIRPSQSVGNRKKITIKAARNEYESFQIAIAGPATITDAKAVKLKGPATIGTQHIKIFREGLIKINQVSNYDGAKGWWPDALIPKRDVYTKEIRNAFPLMIPSGENRVLWIDIFVPPHAPAGKYSGEILVYGQGGELTRVAYILKVWDFTLPSVASLPTAFGFSGWDALSGHFANRDKHYDHNTFHHIPNGNGHGLV